jgi:hypothetical protein
MLRGGYSKKKRNNKNYRNTRKITKTGTKGRCQCIISCRNPSITGKHFCEFHMNKCPRISPLSGFEPNYEPKRWNADRSIRETHNCFSYSMNINDPHQIKLCADNSEDCEAPFHQPGSPSGYHGFTSKKLKTCPNMIARILGDNPDIRMTTFESRCPVNTSKIALVVDPKEDYHFLRQDSNMLWSQKAGGRPVKNVDAAGHTIWDPQLSYLNYNSGETTLNYSIFCAYLCVPRIKKLYLLPGGGKS